MRVELCRNGEISQFGPDGRIPDNIGEMQGTDTYILQLLRVVETEMDVLCATAVADVRHRMRFACCVAGVGR